MDVQAVYRYEACKGQQGDLWEVHMWELLWRRLAVRELNVKAGAAAAGFRRIGIVEYKPFAIESARIIQGHTDQI